MKRVIICALLTAGIAVLSVCSEFYISGKITGITQTLQTAIDSLQAGDDNQARELVDKGEQQWSDFFRHRLLVADKEHITGITNEFARLIAFDTGHDDFLPQCVTVIHLLEMFKEKQDLNLYNVL
jgi:hypothetical protein